MTTNWQKAQQTARARDSSLRRQLRAYLDGKRKLPRVNKPTQNTFRICNEYGVDPYLVIVGSEYDAGRLAHEILSDGQDKVEHRKAKMRERYARQRKDLGQSYNPREPQEDDVLDKIALQLIKGDSHER